MSGQLHASTVLPSPDDMNSMKTKIATLNGKETHVPWSPKCSLITITNGQERQWTYNVIEARSPNHCCRGKATSITYSGRVFVALVIQRAKRMRCVVLSPVASPALQYLSTLSHRRHDFREKKKTLPYIKCVLWYSLQVLSTHFSFYEEFCEIS